jgi:hypothetical protein
MRWMYDVAMDPSPSTGGYTQRDSAAWKLDRIRRPSENLPERASSYA